MKVDIPNSIIISRDKEGVLHHSYWTTDQQLVPFDETTFVRKDTLLEILKGYNHPVTRLVIQEIIDKINSM